MTSKNAYINLWHPISPGTIPKFVYVHVFFLPFKTTLTIAPCRDHPAEEWQENMDQENMDQRGKINSVQTRCIVKGEAQKSPLFWRFSGGLCFSQDRLFSRNSNRKPLNLIKSPIFTNAPCKTACLYDAPSMHTAEIERS